MVMTGCNTLNAWNITSWRTKLDALKQRSICISSMGQKAYKILRNIVAPNKPTDVSFKNLVLAMTSHFSPPPSKIVQRFRFNSRIRKQGETVAAYIAELRALSEYCNYGDTLDSMLHDRLVCGVDDVQIQKQLLAEDKLTFKKALDISLALEAATKDTKQLQAALATPGMATQFQYTKCGKERNLHQALSATAVERPTTRHQNVVTRALNVRKRGIWLKCVVAPSIQVHQVIPTIKIRTNMLTSDTQVLGEYQLFSIQQEGTGSYTKPLTVLVTINGKSVTMEIDTGSSVSTRCIKNSNLRKEVGIAIKSKETSSQFESVRNSYVAIMHQPVTICSTM